MHSFYPNSGTFANFLAIVSGHSALADPDCFVLLLINTTENMVMLKTPTYAVPLFAFAGVFALAAAGIAMADSVKFPESGKGTQKEPTIIGDKSTPKREPTHSAGAVTTHNPNVGPLRGPEIRESGMGKLEGGEKQGDKNTPKRNPTLAVTAK